MQGDGIKEGLINETVGYLPKQLHAGKKKKKRAYIKVCFMQMLETCVSKTLF